MNKNKTILIAVGSSGGHIYPAVAVAERLEEKLSYLGENLDIHFVHSGSSLGKNILSSLKYPVHEISIGGLAAGQSFFQKIKTVFQLPRAFMQSMRLIKQLKSQVILGTGGSVTGPVLIAGILMGQKTAIWEGNIQMGLTNQWLSPFVSRIFTVFPEVKGASKRKQISCAYPLRKKLASKKYSKPEPPFARSTSFKFSKDIFNVLILGGSQGSVFLNQVVSQALEDESWRKDIFIYHQTGKASFAFMKEKYQSVTGVKAFAFSPNIKEYYEKCDLVFSRAGSGAIWETAAQGKALVLIPLTYSAGGHQLKNALKLFAKNCVEMIREQDFNSNSFKDKVIQLKQDEKKRNQLAQSLKSAHQGDGAGQIAHWLLSSK